MDEAPHELARRVPFFITCRPDDDRCFLTGHNEVGAASRGANREILSEGREDVMTSKIAQWTIWALLMTLFTVLTVAGRWLDLTLALTLSAAFWYGIVPNANSRRQ